MELPALLPETVNYCRKTSSEEDLVELLIQKPIHLVLFFEAVCDDETWSERHPELLKKIISWLTVQALDDRLSFELCRRVANAIQEHYGVLYSLIPTNITVKLKDGETAVNSLLLSASSDLFKNILSIECRDKQTNILNLKETSLELFNPLYEIAAKGSVSELWKNDQSEVETLLLYALSCNADGLIKACQLTLRKYITIGNAIDFLIKAEMMGWIYFKRGCIDFINERMSGFYLDTPQADRLSFEFKHIDDTVMSVFERLQGLITDLVCKGPLVELPNFGKIVNGCPKLLMLDISASADFSPNFDLIPKDLQGMNLTECAWLGQSSLKKVVQMCPFIKELNLSSNYQLDFAAWGELNKFKDLKSLNLAYCHQMTDDELTLILKGCSGLTDFVLDECSKIGDKGFFALAKSLLHLGALHLVHCQISESALLEIAVRCRSLTTLNLSRCHLITERGFLDLAKHAYALRKLIVKDCNVSKGAIETIRERHPYLIIEP